MGQAGVVRRLHHHRALAWGELMFGDPVLLMEDADHATVQGFAYRHRLCEDLACGGVDPPVRLFAPLQRLLVQIGQRLELHPRPGCTAVGVFPQSRTEAVLSVGKSRTQELFHALPPFAGLSGIVQGRSRISPLEPLLFCIRLGVIFMSLRGPALPDT